MLTFGSRFASDEKLGCVLWADGLSQRVRFAIGHQILIGDFGRSRIPSHMIETLHYANASERGSKRLADGHSASGQATV